MPHDPLLVAETKTWFTKAANDIRAAGHELSAVPPLLGDIVFHCQQAAEKGMNEYAWKFRYPGVPDEPEEPSMSEAQEALACAREVYEAVLSRLPAEVRP